MGRLGWSPPHFYDATVSELYDALKDWNEVNQQDMDFRIWQTREIVWATLCVGSGGKTTRAEVYGEIEFDRKSREEMIKHIKPIRVTIDGKEQ